jgi:hypothetical protein
MRPLKLTDTETTPCGPVGHKRELAPAALRRDTELFGDATFPRKDFGRSLEAVCEIGSFRTKYANSANESQQSQRPICSAVRSEPKTAIGRRNAVLNGPTLLLTNSVRQRKGDRHRYEC